MSAEIPKVSDEMRELIRLTDPYYCANPECLHHAMLHARDGEACTSCECVAYQYSRENAPLDEVLPDEIERALSDISQIAGECFDASMRGTGKALQAIYTRLRKALLRAQVSIGIPLPTNAARASSESKTP